MKYVVFTVSRDASDVAFSLIIVGLGLVMTHADARAATSMLRLVSRITDGVSDERRSRHSLLLLFMVERLLGVFRRRCDSPAMYSGRLLALFAPWIRSFFAVYCRFRDRCRLA